MVLPLGLSAPPLHRRPYATAVLVLAMLGVFVYVLQLREAAPALFCSDLTESVVVHAGWLHLLANLAFLAAFAPRVEEDLGPTGLVALFFGSAVLAAGAHVLLVPDLTAPGIGASGGVAGILGAHLLAVRPGLRRWSPEAGSPWSAQREQVRLRRLMHP